MDILYNLSHFKKFSDGANMLELKLKSKLMVFSLL